MLAVISSANLVMIYENNHAIGYLTEHFASKADAIAYAKEVTTNIVFED